MPVSQPTLRRTRVDSPRSDPKPRRGGALVVMDDGPLKRAAWAELHAARKRQEKAARDLHRHEQSDLPGYETWLHRTFPTFITRLRELHQEVYAKGQKVQYAQEEAMFTGRSVNKIWREQRKQEANPPPAPEEKERDTGKGRRGPFGAADDFFGDDEEEEEFRLPWEDMFEPKARGAEGSRPGADARDVYRRLVQRLHPDRGGEWTAARQRLWHEVQQAWADGDVDWLIRLEVEWEAAHDILNQGSPLSRLRLAIAEMHAARRDTERKLREYRGSPAWRFTLTEKKRELLHRRTAMNFEHDIHFLERQLTHLNATIASWEKPGRSRRRPRSGFDDLWY